MATEFKCYKSLNLCCSCYWPSCLIDDRKMEEQKPKDQRFKANENKPVMNEWVLSEQFAALQGIAANHVTPTMLKPILCYLSCFSWTSCVKWQFRARLSRNLLWHEYHTLFAWWHCLLSFFMHVNWFALWCAVRPLVSFSGWWIYSIEKNCPHFDLIVQHSSNLGCVW
jgi:hypothetical protein